jgi:hypothetical protein
VVSTQSGAAACGLTDRPATPDRAGGSLPLPDAADRKTDGPTVSVIEPFVAPPPEGDAGGQADGWTDPQASDTTLSQQRLLPAGSTHRQLDGQTVNGGRSTAIVAMAGPASAVTVDTSDLR